VGRESLRAAEVSIRRGLLESKAKPAGRQLDQYLAQCEAIDEPEYASDYFGCGSLAPSAAKMRTRGCIFGFVCILQENNPRRGD
jgi:hypothetical protein